MAHLPNATLTLKTSALNAPDIDTYRTSFNFRNISLRNLLGEMYDDYDMFNLCIKGISTGVSTNAGGSAANRSVTMEIAGFPFRNQTYSQATSNNSASMVLTTFQFSVNAASQQFYTGNEFITFDKRQDLVDFKIAYKRIEDNAAPTSLVAGYEYPHMVFQFDIFGIPKREIAPKQDNTQRLF